MSRLRMVYAGVSYFDRTRALEMGTVIPAGTDFHYLQVADIGELFRRMAQGSEFDAGEMSFSTMVMLTSRGDERFVGLPIFPSRSFRHGFIFVHAGSGIEQPADLKGRRVGIAEYQMTAALWIRAFLQHDYDVRPEDLHWFYGGLDRPVYHERLQHGVPEGVRLEPIPRGGTLEGMLEEGELDALVTPDVPFPVREGSTNIRRLFPNYHEVEREYYTRTGFFPIMHMVVIRRDVYEANRWLAASLIEAFVESKRRGLERLHYLGALPVAVPWLSPALDEMAEVFGEDAFPYGIEPNRAIVEAMLDYSYEQGLSSRRVQIEELFVPEAFFHPADTPPSRQRAAF
jgi:4,5-dihydroxyphthalate decarboxylase